MRSRRSTADSAASGAPSSGSNGSSRIAQDFASVVKFVHSKPLFSDELFHAPRTSAHTALRKYVGAATRSKKRRRQAKADAADGGSGAADGDSSMAATASSSVDGGAGGGSSANGGASSSDGLSGHKTSCGSSVGSADIDVSLSKFEIGLCDALNIQQARSAIRWPFLKLQQFVNLQSQIFSLISSGKQK